MAGLNPGNVVSVPQTYNQHRGIAHTAAMPEGLAEFFIPACAPRSGAWSSTRSPVSGQPSWLLAGWAVEPAGLDIHANRVEEAKHRIADDRPDDPCETPQSSLLNRAA